MDQNLSTNFLNALQGFLWQPISLEHRLGSAGWVQSLILELQLTIADYTKFIEEFDKDWIFFDNDVHAYVHNAFLKIIQPFTIH